MQAGFAATNVIDYAPTRPIGPVQRGSCFSGSLAGDGIPTPGDARSATRSPIHVSRSPERPTSSVCTPDPLTGDSGFPLQITEPLPLSEADLTANGSPWMIELSDGSRCGVATGATGVIEGERINYLCTTEAGQTIGLIGTPQSGLSAGDGSLPLWSAKRAVLAMGDNGPYATDLGWVPLKTVVRGPQQFVPLACGGLARDVAPLLGRPVVTSTVSFEDYVGGGSGLGCRISVEGKGTDYPDVVTPGNPRAYFPTKAGRKASRIKPADRRARPQGFSAAAASVSSRSTGHHRRVSVRRISPSPRATCPPRNATSTSPSRALEICTVHR